MAATPSRWVAAEIIQVQEPAKIIIKYYSDDSDSLCKREKSWTTTDSKIFAAKMHVLASLEEFKFEPKRGYIIDVPNPEAQEGAMDDPIAGVFLYDVGEHRICPLKSLQVLTPESTYAPSSFMVIIPGLVPCQQYTATLSMPTYEFSEDAAKFVSDWIKKCPICVRKIAPIDDITFAGDFIQEGKEEISLGQLLVQKDFAMFDKVQYERDTEVHEEEEVNTPPEVTNRRVNSGDTGTERREIGAGRGKALGKVPPTKEKVAGLSQIDNANVKEDEEREMLSELENKFGEVKLNKKAAYMTEETMDTEGETRIRSAPVSVFLKGMDVATPYETIKDFPYYEEMARELENDMQITQINRLQKCVWPQIMQGRNCFIIGGQSKKKGKSLSYIVPIASKILSQQEKFKTVMGPTGPVCLVICNSFGSGEKIKSHFEALLKSSELHTCLLVPGESDTVIRRSLESNPETIITTPEYGQKLLENFSGLVGFNRIQYIVFDDAHLLFERESKTEGMKYILQRLSQYTKTVKSRYASLYTVFCGQAWNPLMEAAFHEVCNDPVLIISNTVQVLYYGQVKTRVHYCPDDDKLEKLVALAKEDIRKRAIIACREQTTACQLGMRLYRNHGIKTEYFQIGEVTRSQLERMREAWQDTIVDELVLFILTDSDLKELNLEDAQIVVHYEIPETKLEAFGDRHICMWSHVRDICDQNANPGERKELTSHIFLTPDEPDLDKIVLHLIRIKTGIPRDLMNFSGELWENCMKPKSLCPSTKKFGKCWAASRKECLLRHFLVKEEVHGPSAVPKTGRVELLIVKCEDVNEYKAKLLHYYEYSNGQKKNAISYINSLRSRKEVMTKYYSVEENRIPLQTGKKGGMCAVKPIDEDNYYRGRIVEIFEYMEGLRKPKRVRVLCVDTGHHVIRNVEELYVLPTEFRDMSQLCVQVILPDLKPLPGLEEFKANDKLKCSRFTEEKIFNARIKLSIGNTIWVKPMTEYEKDDYGNWIEKTNVRVAIMKDLRIAEDNPTHLEEFYKKCELLGFSCASYRAVDNYGQNESFFLRGDRMQWAYLQISSSEHPKTTNVWVSCVNSPDFIFVQLDKFVDLQETLTKELNKEINSMIEGKYPDYAERFCNSYVEGLCVAVKHREMNEWNRALITKVIEYEDGSKYFDVFFVDYGDVLRDMESLDLFPIPTKFVDTLPFQTIALRVNHVYPTGEEGYDPTVRVQKWSKEVKSFLKNLLIVDDQCIDIDVTALEKLGKLGEYEPACEYYEAFIMLRNNQELGEHMVELGHAKYCSPQMANCISSYKNCLLENLNEQVNRDLRPESDDEGEDGDLFDHDRFDVYVGSGPNSFMDQMLPQLRMNGATKLLEAGLNESTSGPVLTLVPPPLASQAESSNTKEQAPGLQESSNAKPKSTHGVNPFMINVAKSQNQSSREHPAGQPVNLTKKPTVYWHETDEDFNIQICIPDLKKYNFIIDGNRISFVSEEPPNYAFEFDTIGRVRPTYEETPLGPGLKIKMKKVSAGLKWEKPSRAEPTEWWLKPDLDKCDFDVSDDDSDHEMSGAPLGDSMEESFGTQLMQGIPANYDKGDSDEFASSSSDEEISDTELDFAQRS